MLAELFSGRALRPTGMAVAPAVRRDEEDLEHRHSPAAAAAGGSARRDDIPASLLNVSPDADLVEEMEQAVAAEVPPEADETTDEFSVQSVADYLVEQQARIAFAISPSGDDGSAGTVALVREIADRGYRTVLVDMTGSACPTRLMASWRDLPGITDLLTGEAAFADCIHPDRESAADIVPQGNSDIRQAMRGSDRLTIVVDALADVYDIVLVECGPANAEGVARLSRNGLHEIILSAPEPEAEELAAIMIAFEDVGYKDLALLSVKTAPARRARDAA
jgi:Mrp family chromosome partitioning ATPase